MHTRDYPDSGILFVNDRQRTDRDPDHSGRADPTCPRCGRGSDY